MKDVAISSKNRSFKRIVGSSTHLARQSKLAFPIFLLPGYLDFGKPFQNFKNLHNLGPDYLSSFSDIRIFYPAMRTELQRVFRRRSRCYSLVVDAMLIHILMLITGSSNSSFLLSCTLSRSAKPKCWTVRGYLKDFDFIQFPYTCIILRKRIICRFFSQELRSPKRCSDFTRYIIPITNMQIHLTFLAYLIVVHQTMLYNEEPLSIHWLLTLQKELFRGTVYNYTWLFRKWNFWLCCC